MEKLQSLAAVMYQILGNHNVPEEILDTLAKAANGEDFPDPLGLLPYSPRELTEEMYLDFRENSKAYSDSLPILIQSINEFFLGKQC